MEGRHQMQLTGLRQCCGFGPRFVEVLAALNDRRPQCPHGGVFFQRVAFRYHDTDRQTQAPGRERQALPMIATGGGDQAFDMWLPSQQTLHI